MGTTESAIGQEGGGRAVDAHAACVRCGYDLHGLSSMGQCPECGTSIARTLRGNLLWFSPMWYLRALRSGILLLIIGTAVSTLVGLAMPFVTIALIMTGNVQSTPAQHPPASPFASPLDPQVEAILVFSSMSITIPATVLMVIGCWQLAGIDPSYIGPDRSAGVRKGIRVLAAVAGGLAVMAIFVALFKFMTQHVAAIALELGFGAVSVLVWIALFFLSLIYLRTLAGRVPNESIARWAGRYLWLLPIIYIVGSCVLIGPLVATVLYLVLLGRFRTAVGRILQQREAAGETEEDASFIPRPM